MCVYFATIGFGLLINLPRKALNMAGIVSLIGWLVFH
ncbi:MAG: threonine/serine exporter family protein, partial [Apilactobacillus kunkeei]|nr:threonine/serine exporter family protein [Apilactobacillus kunkeei]